MKPRHLSVCAAALAVATAGCGGGGGSASSPLPPGGSPPPVTQFGNQFTSYSIFSGLLNGETVIDVQPIGNKSTIPGAVAAMGSVLYPDGSIQLADAKGNFDASTSSWAMANLSALAASPDANPIVDISYAPASGAVPLPEEVFIVAYSASVNEVPLGTPLGGLAQELQHVSVLPNSAWLADGRNRIFTAVGKDQTGASFPLNKSQVMWSITRAAGCGSAAGTIAAIPSDPTRAVYTAPKNGNISANCPDLVSASVAANGATYAGSGSAFSYDPATAPKLKGVLNDASGKPVAKAVIDLYGAGADAAQGSLLVETDAQGNFSRSIPANRVITPVINTANGSKSQQYSISPSSINPATAGSALQNQTWKLVAVTSVPKPPTPSYNDMIRDASTFGAIMQSSLPVDVPGSNGKFANGTMEAVLASPAPNAKGTLSAGELRNYAYAWDATAKIATFTQPGPSAEARVFTVTINAAKVAGAACASGAQCYSYINKRGSMLLNDGAWQQSIASGKYALSYVDNLYNSTHQVSGSPLYTDTTTANITLAASGPVNFTQTHALPNGSVLAQVTTAHTSGNSPVLYNFTGSVKDLPGGSSKSEVDYALNVGVRNDDGSGSYKFVETNSPVSVDKNATVNYVQNSTSNAASQSVRVNGTIDIPSITNTKSGHAASFFVDSHNVVHLTLDANLGGATSTFQL